MHKHTAPISGVATIGNDWVLTAGYDNRVILWNAKNKMPVNRVFHDHLANQCTFSPCGHYVATVSSDYSCRIWTFPELMLFGIIKMHKDDVESVSFHPEKPLVATCSRDKTIVISDLNGNPIQHLKGHCADVISVEWGRSGNLISSSDDGTIRVWDPDSGEQVQCIDLDNVETDTIAIAPCGTIFAGNDNGEIITIAQGTMRMTLAHEAGIKRLVYDAEHQVMVSLSYDRKMKLWRERDGVLENYHTADLPAIIWPRSCAFLNEDNLVFASFGDSYAQYIISAKTWQLDHIKPTQGLNAVQLFNGELWSVGDAGNVYRGSQIVTEIGSLCNFICEFNGILLTGGQMGTLFNAQTGEIVYQHHSPLNCAASIGGDNAMCVVGTYTGEGIVLREVDGKVQVIKVIGLHANAIKGVALSDVFIFSVCADSSTAFHNTDDLSCHQYIPNAHGKIANGCDGNGTDNFVSVSRDLKLRLWHKDGVTVIDTPSLNSIKCVALSKDKRHVSIGNYTGWVGIFDIAEQQWSYWQRRSFSGISSIKATDDNFVFSTYEGICEFVLQG
ncbi:WD40 repeat domain-containing protein [Serratia sp. L9]|uniref:WD40 repeat domain-containing protein n=1 Tax=Serratia sp. L9 TaxID=3423946 RepID=UPI003D66AAF7